MRARCDILLAVSAAVAAGGCADISPPNRSADSYDWQLLTSEGELTFNWPTSSLPVKIWVEDSLGLLDHTAAGIETWKAQLLYAEWDAVIVSDSSTADVVLGFSVIPAVRSVKLFNQGRLCSGVTSFPLVGSTITLPFRVRITNRAADPTSPEAQSCFAVTVAHELGHTMGLFQESDDLNDLMYGIDPTTGPSTRDRNSVQRLYHTQADLTASR